MKKKNQKLTLTCIIFFLILSIYNVANCQDSYFLTDSARTWNVGEFGAHGGGSITYKYFFNGTIIIQDTVYNVLKMEALYPNNEKSDNSSIVGYIREDTIQKTVYFKKGEFSDEKLLYDFSIGEGDQIELPDFTSHSYTVEKVDSIMLLDGKKRKRITLVPGYQFGNIIWIEGIGNITGYLVDPVSTGLGTIEKYLLCAYESDALIYQEEFLDFNTCVLFSTNNEEFMHKEEAFLFPNPSKDYFRISGIAGNTYMLQIIHPTGKIILEQKVSAGENVDVSNLKQGIYIVRISDNENNLKSHKLYKL